MSISPELEESIRNATNKLKQPETVANRLIAWLKQMSDKDLGKEQHNQFFENLRREIINPDYPTEEERNARSD